MTSVITEMREVSIAVPSISAIETKVSAMIGNPGFEVQSEPEQPIAARFKSYPVGARSIAFMESLGDNATIDRFIARRGGVGGLFSASFATDDIDQACARLRAAGAKVVLDQPMTLRELRSGSYEWESIRVNFVALTGPMSGLVVELQELHGGTPSGIQQSLGTHPVSVNELHFACHDVDAAASWLVDAFGMEVGPVVEQRQPPEEVRFRNLYVGDKPMLAVIAPATQTSTIHRFLDRRGPGMFALSMRVNDCQRFTQLADEGGVAMLFDKPKAAHDTYIGSKHLDEASINWVKPDPDTGQVLFEIQEFVR